MESRDYGALAGDLEHGPAEIRYVDFLRVSLRHIQVLVTDIKLLS